VPIATYNQGEYRIGSERSATILASDIAAIRTPPEVHGGLFSDWHATTDLGYTTTRGNSHTTQLALQFQPQRRSVRDAIKLDIQALSGLANGGDTNRQSLETRYDRFVSPRLFYFFVGKSEHDRLEALKLRVRQGTGLGVRMKLGATTQLSTLSGFSFVEEHFSGQDFSHNAEGLFGYEFETRAIAPFQITSKAQFLPNFANLGRFRSEWDTAIRVPFARHVNVGVRLFHRFDSEPAAGARKGRLRFDLDYRHDILKTGLSDKYDPEAHPDPDAEIEAHPKSLVSPVLTCVSYLASYERIFQPVTNPEITQTGALPGAPT
jgi:putative salt-induced outer membrane protein YdiY